MSDALIKVSRLSEVSIEIEAGALQQKSEALESAGCVQRVAGETDQLVCVEVLRDIKRLRNLCESSRVLVKEPVLRLGRDIDAKAKAFDLDLAREENRLAQLHDGYVAEQRRIADEAERKRREEIERVERERKAAEDKAQREAEVERQRIEQERRVAAHYARNERERIEAEQRARAANAEAAERERQDKIIRDREAQAQAVKASTAIVPAPAKPDGMRINETWEFEVLDPEKVYKFRADLCVVTVQKAAVKAALRRGLRDCPGLRIWKETKATVLI